jgi:hypothetical protein
MFNAAIRNKKNPDTSVPMMLVVYCKCEFAFLTWSSKARMPKFSSSASRNTTVEWPREKKNPTDIGRSPSLTSLRVVLSIAAMWSASNACRIPRV